MSDSEELPRKTSKGFCSDSLSLPDDAEEDEAEEEAFLLALGSLATFSQRQPTLCTKFAPRHNGRPHYDPKWPPRHNLCTKFTPRHNGRPRYVDNYGIHGVSKPTNITRGSHPARSVWSIHLDGFLVIQKASNAEFAIYNPYFSSRPSGKLTVGELENHQFYWEDQLFL